MKNPAKSAAIAHTQASLAAAAESIKEIPEFLPKEAAPSADEALFWQEYRQVEEGLKRLKYFLSRMEDDGII